MQRIHVTKAGSLWIAAGLVALPWVGAAGAEMPGEITGVEFTQPTRLEWNAGGYPSFNLYRGGIAGLSGGAVAYCRAFDIDVASAELPEEPPTSEGYYYLVTGQSQDEGPAGADSSGSPRRLLGSCVPVMQSHVLDRLGYGWDEWTGDRIDTLGLEGYIAEQLAPETINESLNLRLLQFLAPIDPPTDLEQLIQQDVIRAVYSRRQLEQQAALFWANHFNTYWQKIVDVFYSIFPYCQQPDPPPQCDPSWPQRSYETTAWLQYQDMESFRYLAFHGSFRDMVEASSNSLAMMIYLDTWVSVAGDANENYARELMELHTMGVDCGYTQTDVEELARVFTGWSGCKKTLDHLDDPLASCIEDYWRPLPEGDWVANFVPENHDCTAKALFAGTPYETVIPDTCEDPEAGVNDRTIALDAIVSHPCTASFISRKILEKFVTDDPEQEQVDQLVAVWNDPGNPHGIGDMKAVLEAALTSEWFLDPTRIGGKIKTPLEYLASTFRATRGTTDGLAKVFDYLISMKQLTHYNSVPKGFPEDGSSWIGTGNTLDRQDFGFDLLASPDPNFQADPIALLEDHGVSTAPGNAETIIDFYSEVLFGTALTPAERQLAIDYLETDAFGVPAEYDDARIREVIGVMLGYPQFQEQ